MHSVDVEMGMEWNALEPIFTLTEGRGRSGRGPGWVFHFPPGNNLGQPMAPQQHVPGGGGGLQVLSLSPGVPSLAPGAVAGVGGVAGVAGPHVVPVSSSFPAAANNVRVGLGPVLPLARETTLNDAYLTHAETYTQKYLLTPDARRNFASFANSPDAATRAAFANAKRRSALLVMMAALAAAAVFRLR